MTTTGLNEGRFCDRTDAHHVLSQLPPVGGQEHALVAFTRAVERWRPMNAKEPSGGLVLMGPTGCGKTTALVYMARRLLARLEVATSTLFVIASELVEDKELTEKAKRVRFLFIDDAGKETDKANRLFQVLDYRHTRAPTFISTGLRTDDLEAHYDGATCRRMFEFRGQTVPIVSGFVAAPRLAAVRPPSDQEALAKRLGETL